MKHWTYEMTYPNGSKQYFDTWEEMKERTEELDLYRFSGYDSVKSIWFDPVGGRYEVARIM